MRILFRKAGGFVLLLSVSFCALAQPSNSLTKQWDEIFTRELYAKTGRDTLPGAALKIQSLDKKIVWNSPGSSSTRTYPIASVSKTFTATVVLKLAEERKLTLTASIGIYLSHPKVDSVLMKGNQACGDGITIYQLLTHTSGLADHAQSQKFIEDLMASPDRKWTVSDILDYYIDNGFNRDTTNDDSHFNYSDMNYILLGMIIESVTHQSLANVYRQLIFDPLNLKSPYLKYYECPPDGYEEMNPFMGATNLAFLNTSFEWGAGGLVMSVDDLCTFVTQLYTGALFNKKETLDLMLKTIQVKHTHYSYFAVGLGVYEIEMPDDVRFVGHSGFFKSFTTIFPTFDLVFVGSLNQVEADHLTVLQKFIEPFKQFNNSRPRKPVRKL